MECSFNEFKSYKKIEGSAWDIIGDIHGEFDSLLELLHQLGYDEQGNHRMNRKMIFVGDIVDRGNKTVSCIKKVKELVQNGKAYAVLGNHELNTLNNDPKTGAGWYFENLRETDAEWKYEPCEKLYSEKERQEIIDFFKQFASGTN